MAEGTNRTESPVARDDRERNQWWLVLAAGLAVFMASVDMSIVNVALPAIERDFEIPCAVPIRARRPVACGFVVRQVGQDSGLWPPACSI